MDLSACFFLRQFAYEVEAPWWLMDPALPSMSPLLLVGACL